MPSFERGVYEPPNDDIRVFDDDEQDLDEEGSRLPLVIVIALLVLALFAGVVWLAYSQGVQRGRSDAPRMIAAAPGPAKEAVADDESGQHSLKIYQQPAPADDTDDESTPPPTATAKMTAPAKVAKPSVPVSAPASKPAPALLKPTPVIEKPVEKSAVKTSVVTTKPDAAVVQKPLPGVAAPPSKVEAIAPKAETPASVGGAYALQIGAYKSQADADAAWKAYQFKHPVAAGYSEEVRKADLGDKGIWYRLRIGSFADKAAAGEVCDKLKADGGACLIAK